MCMYTETETDTYKCTGRHSRGRNSECRQNLDVGCEGGQGDEQTHHGMSHQTLKVTANEGNSSDPQPECHSNTALVANHAIQEASGDLGRMHTCVGDKGGGGGGAKDTLWFTGTRLMSSGGEEGRGLPPSPLR